MVTNTKAKVFEIINKNPGIQPGKLASLVQVTPQALHRHLRDLCRAGRIAKSGTPPLTGYRALGSNPLSPQISKDLVLIREILGSHPAVKLVTLFGSQARNEATTKSDIDLLIWIDPSLGFTRHDLWQYWDRQARRLPFQDKASLIVKPFSNDIFVDTLLLDFPEEHILVYDSDTFFTKMREAVLKWRKQWGAQKIPSFGGTHAWTYSKKVKHLSEIDFRLELNNVA